MIQSETAEVVVGDGYLCGACAEVVGPWRAGLGRRHRLPERGVERGQRDSSQPQPPDQDDGHGDVGPG